MAEHLGNFNNRKIHSVSFAFFYHYIRLSAISFGGRCSDQFIVKRGGFLYMLRLRHKDTHLSIRNWFIRNWYQDSENFKKL